MINLHCAVSNDQFVRLIIDLEATSDGEPAVTDDLQAEYIEENPFSFEQDISYDDVTNAEVNFLFLDDDLVRPMRGTQ